MTKEQARHITIASAKVVLTEDQIPQDILNQMVLESDNFKGKQYEATWINLIEKLKLILTTDNIYDETCPVLIQVIAS